MPTWPPSDIDTTDADSDTDSPVAARQDILAAIVALNQIRNHVSTLMQSMLAATTEAGARAVIGAAGIDDGFVSGTRMIFHNAAAPTGWTQDVSSWDHALRVVGTAGGGTGGTVGFSTISAQSVAGHSLSTAELAAHSHANVISATLRQWTTPGVTAHGLKYGDGSTVISEENSGSPVGNLGAALTVGISNVNAGSGNAHVHGVGFQPQYTNVIICQKN